MKKLIAFLLVLMLLCPVAIAEGFGGLTNNGGGFAGLDALFTGPLPDPAELLGTFGSLLQENYQFSADYLCNAYVYPSPSNWNTFIAAYTQLLTQYGYSSTAVTVDGINCYQIQSNGQDLYALLVPNFHAHLMLLVENGMNFSLPKAQGASSVGYGGPVWVDVEFFANGKIASLSIGNEAFAETDGMGSRVPGNEDFICQFIGMQAPVNADDIDVVAGATITSNAVISAINKAYDSFNAEKQ